MYKYLYTYRYTHIYIYIDICIFTKIPCFSAPKPWFVQNWKKKFDDCIHGFSRFHAASCIFKFAPACVWERAARWVSIFKHVYIIDVYIYSSVCVCVCVCVCMFGCACASMLHPNSSDLLLRVCVCVWEGGVVYLYRSLSVSPLLSHTYSLFPRR